MELSTPNKNKTSSVPLSQFENSPVFDYINNLSPIELVKSINIDPTLNSLSFSSPPSVFASPQLNSRRETRCLIRRVLSSDTSNPEVSQTKDDKNTNKGDSEAVKLSDLCGDQLGSSNNRSSAKSVFVEPPGERLELAIELQNSLKCDGASLDGDMVPLGTVSADAETEVGSNAKAMRSTYVSEKDLRRISLLDQNEDEAGCDWVALISDVADTLTFDSSVIEEHSEEEKIVDPGTISFVSNVLLIPQDIANDLENTESVGCLHSYQENEIGEPVDPSKEFEEQRETQQVPSLFPGTTLNKVAVNEETAKVDVKGKKCCQSGCKNKIRRRCLLFEMSGARKKNGSLISSQSDCEVPGEENHLTPVRTGKAKTFSPLSGRGIGLHLNALAAGSSDGKVVKIETIASGEQETNLLPCDDENKIVETSSQALMAIDEDSSITSPKMKRHKVEHVEAAACKRCNCKRSKCLKLYCECFAAGLYCIEPCSCQDCFNKPAHEDTVLETRKLIESRNPLAFAPKVIISADSVSEFGDETNKTPASARHKRGCNCKKSSCLKKYCECFQGGVGCSAGCRCEGCKNTFGSKNGGEEIELESQQSETCDKNAADVTSQYDLTENADKEHPDHPSKPSETARSPIQLSKTFSQQLSEPSRSAAGLSIQIRAGQKLRPDFFCCQPKFKMQLHAIPEHGTPDQILTSIGSPTSDVRSASPNSKRVSPPRTGPRSSSWKTTRKLILRSVPPFPSLNLLHEK